MLKDLKHAVRLLLNAKGWTLVVLLSLALGIGANTALFSALSGLMLQTLPVGDPESFVRLSWYGDNHMMRSSSEYGTVPPVNGKNSQSTFSYAGYLELRRANRTLTDLAAQAPIGPLNVIINDESDLASTLGVSGNYFAVLQLRPALGRLLTDADDQPGAPLVAVISHAFWNRRFGADPQITGRVVTMNGQPVTIVGVAPAAFGGIQRLGAAAPDVMVPLSLDMVLTPTQVANPKDLRLKDPTYWFIQLVGRLKPGISTAHVQANLEPVLQQTARAGMDAFIGSLTPEQRQLSTNQREGSSVPNLSVASAAHGIYGMDRATARSATMLTAVVVVILLIVCANVANLLLSRAAARQKELGVRLSMGASRARLIRQLLTESILLAGVGGLLGLLVAYWSRQLLPFGTSTPIDWRVYAFAGGLSLATGVLFGLAPAFRATHLDLARVTKETSRSISSTRSILSKGLIVLQVALSLVLIVGAGLFLRTLHNLRSVDVGFDTSNLLIFSVNPSLNRYSPDRTLQVLRAMQDELRALPGVRSVALTRVALLSGSRSSSSRHAQGLAAEHNLHVMTVSPEFFETLSIPVVRGRGFTDRDGLTAPKVAVINEAAARLVFGAENPLGRRMGSSLETSGEYEVVGVIRDTKYTDLRAPAPPTWYDSYLQAPPRGAMQFVVRTTSDPAAFTASVRSAIRRVDSTLPITNMATQAARLEGRFEQERLFAHAYSIFGALALLLACVGLFAVMSYNVARRTNEIGVRMALGARGIDVTRMVLSECWWLIGGGVALGVAVALAAGRLIQQVLFGLEPTDAVTLASAAVLIALVATLAGFLPARRASRVDPLVALARQ